MTGPLPKSHFGSIFGRATNIYLEIWLENLCEKCRLMGDDHPLLYKPLLYWVDEFIPYYMEIMGV